MEQDSSEFVVSVMDPAWNNQSCTVQLVPQFYRMWCPNKFGQGWKPGSTELRTVDFCCSTVTWTLDVRLFAGHRLWLIIAEFSLDFFSAARIFHHDFITFCLKKLVQISSGRRRTKSVPRALDRTRVQRLLYDEKIKFIFQAFQQSLIQQLRIRFYPFRHGLKSFVEQRAWELLNNDVANIFSNIFESLSFFEFCI